MTDGINTMCGARFYLRLGREADSPIVICAHYCAPDHQKVPSECWTSGGLVIPARFRSQNDGRNLRVLIRHIDDGMKTAKCD